MITKHYEITKGTNDGNLKYAWQLTCNGKHLQWFSDEVIARKTCDELNARELLSELKKDNKQCGSCKYCEQSGSIFDAGVGYCTKIDKVTRVSLGSYCCDEWEEEEK